jgi:hypothetical protein
MKRWILGLIVGLLLASPVIAEEHELDIEQAFEHMELEHARAEFEFEQQAREMDLEERRLELEMMRRNLDRPREHHEEDNDDKEEGAFLLLCVIVNILMTLWVYQDVRKRNHGNGIWIAITLLAGFFGAAVYALIRIGDSKAVKMQE